MEGGAVFWVERGNSKKFSGTHAKMSNMSANMKFLSGWNPLGRVKGKKYNRKKDFVFVGERTLGWISEKQKGF